MEVQWPALEKYLVPIGKARKVYEGSDLTIVSSGRSLFLCDQAVQKMKKQGNSIELIDMRSLYPYDWKLIKESIKKTKKVLFVNEDTEVTNFGEHLAYRTAKECFYDLHAAPVVLAGKHLPGVGLHPYWEENTVPTVLSIFDKAEKLLLEKP